MRFRAIIRLFRIRVTFYTSDKLSRLVLTSLELIDRERLKESIIEFKHDFN